MPRVFLVLQPLLFLKDHCLWTLQWLSSMNRPDLVKTSCNLDADLIDKKPCPFSPFDNLVHQRPEPYDRPDAAASRDSVPARPPPDSDEALFGSGVHYR